MNKLILLVGLLSLSAHAYEIEFTNTIDLGNDYYTTVRNSSLPPNAREGEIKENCSIIAYHRPGKILPQKIKVAASVEYRRTQFGADSVFAIVPPKGSIFSRIECYRMIATNRHVRDGADQSTQIWRFQSLDRSQARNILAEAGILLTR